MNKIQYSKDTDQHSRDSNQPEKRHIKINEINYRNNLDSDYTEKIEALEKSFDYANNSTYYWSKPEMSILYGSPLYDIASESQKLALNHMYWVAQYDGTAAAEASTIHYNQVTAGVFSHLGIYDDICSNLKLEADQERYHIHAFHNIVNKTKISVLGKRIIFLPIKKTSNSKKKLHQKMIAELSNHLSSEFSSDLQYNSFRYLSRVLLKNSTDYYSSYLKALDDKGESLNPRTKGILEIAISKPLLQFFTFCLGSSPFLACQYFTYRYAANLALKNYEYNYSRYFRELDRKGDFIPVPTAVSHYHLLDESFHTTTSQLIGKDMYKDFPKPGIVEKTVANWGFYLVQQGFLGGFPSGVIGIFIHESSFMPLYYRILRSPVFDMSKEDALQWMENCLCQEHEGFHVQAQYHQRLLNNMLRLTSNLDYLWPVNREMRIMKAGGSIERAIINNVKAFHQFKETVTA